MKYRVYIDTSVIGGYFDDEFKNDTIKLFDKIYSEEFQVYISEITELELLEAPEKVKELVTKIPESTLIRLELNKESEELAQKYISENVLGQASQNDAYHIALASVNRLDVLISWNFKHIVNFNKIRLFNSANLKNGYPQIDIRSPKELIDHDN